MSQQDPHLSDRAAKAARIIAAPREYKICEGCESIVGAGAVTCPNCHGYRFDDDPSTVIDHARILGARPQSSVTRDDLDN